jgi:hypothetical protein
MTSSKQTRKGPKPICSISYDIDQAAALVGEIEQVVDQGGLLLEALV